MSNYRKVSEFHDVFGGIPDDRQDMLNLRKKLITEECAEVIEAIEILEKTDVLDRKKAEADVLKECIDLLYVTYGTIKSMGWDADAAFQEVHRSNMSKVGEDGKPVYREDGKILKGPNYSPANMEEYVS